MEVIGQPDLQVLANAQRRANFFEEGSNELVYDVEDSVGNLRIPGTKPLGLLLGSESETFLDFLGRILVWDPEQRITPIEALMHPWIIEGLPDHVLVHHRKMLGLDQNTTDELDEISEYDSAELART